MTDMSVLSARILFVSAVVLSVCCGQSTLGEPQRTVIEQVLVAALLPSNLTDLTNVTNPANHTLLNSDVNTTMDGSTAEKSREPMVPTTLRAVIGLMTTQGNSTKSSHMNGRDTTTSNQNVTEIVTQNTAVNQAPSSTSAISETQQTTTTLPETPDRTHAIISDTSSAAHSPDGTVIDGFPNDARTDKRTRFPSTPDISNPVTKQLEEPIELSKEQTQQGSLPLVLGAAIVVIFVSGVAGAAVTSKCRRRKLAIKDSLSESSSASDLERGIDNPMFLGANKKTEDLSVVFKAIPGNSRIHNEMRYASPFNVHETN